MTEHFWTGPKKPGQRGMAKTSTDLIEKMYDIIEEIEPVTGRGVGYKLFTAGLIPSMGVNDMKKVYRLLKIARERGDIPWDWIVDETRELEKLSSWSNLADYARTVGRSYRRDFWEQQPCRVEVWSEKGTIRGVLKPVLDQYGVGFRVMHGFTSATTAHEIAEDNDGRELHALYVGDFDPSGLFMSEVDLPNRFESDEYEADHVDLQRIALTKMQTARLPSFPATDKIKDSRYRWFVKNHGKRCWEIDAMDPNDLRRIVRQHINRFIEDEEAWKRCETVYEAEQASLKEFADQMEKLNKRRAP